MPTPLVSVILPTFNRLQYLPAAIDSVRAQLCRDWELIVADDGSDQPTRAYLETVAQLPQARVLWRTHVGNPGAVRNAALREARGEYVAFLDSDDLWMPAKLQAQVVALRADPARQWCYTEFIRIDDAGESVDAERNPHRVLHAGEIAEQLLRLQVGIAVPTVMVRRALLEKAGGFDEQLPLHEDTELWLRLALLSPVAVLSQPLTCVRRHREQYSRGGIPMYQARRRVLEKMQAHVTRPSHRSVLKAERARNAAALAIAHARAGDRVAVWQTLSESWRYAWRSPAWQLGGAKALARLGSPRWLLTMARR
jgi:glycosyltransferase involved in cell wall biosynthesis